MFRIVTFVAAALALVLQTSAVRAADPQDASPVSAKGLKAAVLPVLNLSGEKDAKQRADQIGVGQSAIEKLLGQRGFTLVPSADVEATIKKLNIDLTDEENHRKAVLYGIGREVGADMLIFFLIQDVDQRHRPTLLGSDVIGRARVKTWALDVRNEKPIVNGVTTTSESKDKALGAFASGAHRIRKAVEKAAGESLAPFLKGFVEVSDKETR